jgi:hypothetical protein
VNIKKVKKSHCAAVTHVLFTFFSTKARHGEKISERCVTKNAMKLVSGAILVVCNEQNQQQSKAKCLGENDDTHCCDALTCYQKNIRRFR